MDRLSLEIGLSQPEIDRIEQLIISSKISPDTFKYLNDEKLVSALKGLIAENAPKEGKS